jgi:type II secretory pathway predicted ATPase ExeA
MAIPIMVLGESGSGKTRSAKNLDPAETLIIQPIKKPLPFRSSEWKAWNKETKSGSVYQTDDYKMIKRWIDGAEIIGKKYVIIDDAQYLMLSAELRRSDETGYKKFTEMARDYVDLVTHITNHHSNLIVYFLTHTETNEDGRITAKTTGKMIREKVVLEGLFSIVLRCHAKDGQYYFTTHTNGFDCVKTPEEMFSSDQIENDLNIVNQAVIEYGYFN